MKYVALLVIFEKAAKFKLSSAANYNEKRKLKAFDLGRNRPHNY